MAERSFLNLTCVVESWERPQGLYWRHGGRLLGGATTDSHHKVSNSFCCWHGCCCTEDVQAGEVRVSQLEESGEGVETGETVTTRRFTSSLAVSTLYLAPSLHHLVSGVAVQCGPVRPVLLHPHQHPPGRSQCTCPGW